MQVGPTRYGSTLMDSLAAVDGDNVLSRWDGADGGAGRPKFGHFSCCRPKVGKLDLGMAGRRGSRVVLRKLVVGNHPLRAGGCYGGSKRQFDDGGRSA